jgi:dTDP-glucose pyrophosphorylase
VVPALCANSIATVKDTEPWFSTGEISCVVLAAGEGKRLYPHTLSSPKVLLSVGGRPLLAHVVDYWSRFTENFIFVLHYKGDLVEDFVRQLSVRSVCVEQKELKGIANAVECASPYVSERFILVLGDCFADGQFYFPKEMVQGIGVWQTNDKDAIRHSYSVEHEQGMVYRVVEKPKTLPNDLCGLGFYFFDRRVFEYIKWTPPSPLRAEVEITDVIQQMIDGGEQIAAVPYKGSYVNITVPADIRRVEKILET